MPQSLSAEAQYLVNVIDQVLRDRYNAEELAYLKAKALHESGFATSHCYQNGNNPWGMKKPNIRPTLAADITQQCEGDDEFATYTTLTDAVNDIDLYYSYWQQYRTGSLAEMDESIPYHEDANYQSAIAGILENYQLAGFNEASGHAIGTSWVVVAVVVLLLWKR